MTGIGMTRGCGLYLSLRIQMAKFNNYPDVRPSPPSSISCSSGSDLEVRLLMKLETTSGVMNAGDGAVAPNY